MKILHCQLSGREESDPSPMGYGRRGPAASGAWRNGNGAGGLGATPGSQRYVQPTVKDKHGVNFSCGNLDPILGGIPIQYLVFTLS